MLRRVVGLLLPAAAAALVLAGCGEDGGAQEVQISGDTLTVYSSVPLRGPLASVSRDVVRAEKLALREAGGRAGTYKVNYVSLDSTDPETGRWDAGAVAANARKAVQDRQTIAYLGELETGASAVSLPILNAAGILQVSQRDTFGGLTERGEPGEPARFYPSGRRTFTRVVPADDAQAVALASLMRTEGVRRLVVADDGLLAGASMSEHVAQQAEQRGIEVVDRLRLDAEDELPDDLGEDVRDARPDAFFYGGAYGELATRTLRAVHAAVPAARLYGADDLAISPELPRRAGPAAERLELTGVDPAPQGRDRAFERRFAAAYGARPDRQAVLGYRAMRLVLDGVRRAGAGAASRQEVVERALERAGRPRARFVRYRVAHGGLVRIGPPL